MAGHLEVSVSLLNNNIQFQSTSNMHPESPIKFDYPAPIGDGDGYTGLEMLLMSFSGCSSTSIVYLLRKMQKEISSFTLSAKGIRRMEHPTSFEKIYLDITLQSPNTKNEEMERAIKLSEESICPVWSMIKNNVEVIVNYKIIS